MRSQVRHSKVRSSKPSLPGEIRINPILCSQVGQDGRSPIDDVITHTLSEGSRRGDSGPCTDLNDPPKVRHSVNALPTIIGKSDGALTVSNLSQLRRTIVGL
jgi:hypothetical protein